MFRIVLSLCILLLGAIANAEDLPSIEEGAYLLHGRNGQPKPFSVARVEDKWEINSAAPTFPLRLLNCLSNCDFRPMAESIQQSPFPQFRRQFAMSCIANSGFALCKMMDKPLPECGKSAIKAGEPCRVGQQSAGKPIYGLFALFAPGVMPISVTREEAK